MDKSLLSLVKSQAFIDGAWCGTPATPILDKATGEQLARVPDLGVADARRAIEAAHAAFGPWA